jgi:hypothetical protein
MPLNKRVKESLSKLLTIQVSKLVFNKGRDLPNFALKWKEESVMDQYPIIHVTSMPPPDQSINTNSEIQIDPIDKDRLTQDFQ